MLNDCIDTPVPATETFLPESSKAAGLEPGERKRLSVEVLARATPVSQLASDNGVSRKFLYQQAARADEALDETFMPSSEGKDVLYQLPITKSWIQQFVMSLVLLGHTSYRGVVEILQTMFDYPLCIGTVHNIVRGATARARELNTVHELSAIRVGAHDEIFQAGRPVLVGMDVDSTYCYLLAVEDHRDETTWGVHLLDLQAQGLAPKYTIADGGTGLRAGQRAAWKSTPCHGDVFHALQDLNRLKRFLGNRAVSATTAREKLEKQMQRACKKGQGRSFSAKLAHARQREAQEVELAADVATLVEWLRCDILSLAGPDHASRIKLYDFVITELRARESQCPHHIRKLCTMLENHRDNLLAFAAVLDAKLGELARKFALPVAWLHELCQLEGQNSNQPARWQHEAQLRQKMGSRFHPVQTAMREAMNTTPRASSIVENLNSRLRTYFFLRRQIGNEYLDLLRFYFNHHRFARSDRPERQGKSPAELLTGQPQPNWLELLLGQDLFKRN